MAAATGASPRAAPIGGARGGNNRRWISVSASPPTRVSRPLSARDAAMSYVKRILEPGEIVTHVTRTHWRVYLPAILLLLLAIAVLAAANYVAPDLIVVPEIAAAILLVLAVVSWIPAFLHRWTTELAVTNRRIIFKSGLFRRHTMEMNMAKVESVDVDQSVIGRILGFGTVTIRGTGGGIEPMRNIADPIAFRNHVTAA
jgi:uncharacterized membrane protein YdbT with pleckstrin-like domain